MSNTQTLTSQDNSQSDEVLKIVERARSGDDTVLPQLRQLLASNPSTWVEIGDLSSHALDTWLNLVGNKDHVIKESVRLFLATIRRALDGPAPTQLETLLIDRIVATWLQVQFAEMQAATAKTAGLKEATFFLRRQESAERRHLASIRQLATVRRLLAATKPLGESSPKQAPAGKPAATANGHSQGEQVQGKNGQRKTRKAAKPVAVPAPADAGSLGSLTQNAYIPTNRIRSFVPDEPLPEQAVASTLVATGNGHGQDEQVQHKNGRHKPRKAAKPDAVPAIEDDGSLGTLTENVHIPMNRMKSFLRDTCGVPS